MNVLVFGGLFIFTLMLIFLAGAVILVKEKGTKVMALAGIFVLFFSVGVTWLAYKAIGDYQAKEQIAQEEKVREKLEKLQWEREEKRIIEEERKRIEVREKARAVKEQEIADKAEKEKEIKEKLAQEQAAKNKKNMPATEKKVPVEKKPIDPKEEEKFQAKLAQWDELGGALAEVEDAMYRKVVEINTQIKKISDDYNQGKINGYEELSQRARLEIQKQEIIIKAQNDKKALLDKATLISDEEKKNDRDLLERRKKQAETDREKSIEMLKKVEESSKVFKAL